MRSEIRKILVKRFRREFETRYPRFALQKISAGSSKIWVWHFTPNLHFFVHLQPFEGKDVFTVEIAWSEDGEFPWIRLGEEFAQDKPGWRRRLTRLWNPLNNEPGWNATPEVDEAREALFDAMRRGEKVSYPDPPSPAIEVVIPRIAPLVEDCLQKFREYALPIFEQVAQARGLGHVIESDQ